MKHFKNHILIENGVFNFPLNLLQKLFVLIDCWKTCGFNFKQFCIKKFTLHLQNSRSLPWLNLSNSLKLTYNISDFIFHSSHHWIFFSIFILAKVQWRLNPTLRRNIKKSCFILLVQCPNFSFTMLYIIVIFFYIIFDYIFDTWQFSNNLFFPFFRENVGFFEWNWKKIRNCVIQFILKFFIRNFQ